MFNDEIVQLRTISDRSKWLFNTNCSVIIYSIVELFKWEIVQNSFRQKAFVQYILVGGQLGFCSITVGQLTGGNRRLATRRTTVRYKGPNQNYCMYCNFGTRFAFHHSHTSFRCIVPYFIEIYLLVAAAPYDYIISRACRCESGQQQWVYVRINSVLKFSFSDIFLFGNSDC